MIAINRIKKEIYMISDDQQARELMVDFLDHVQQMTGYCPAIIIVGQNKNNKYATQVFGADNTNSLKLAKLIDDTFQNTVKEGSITDGDHEQNKGV